MTLLDLCRLCKLSYLPPEIFKEKVVEEFPGVRCVANFHTPSGLDAYIVASFSSIDGDCPILIVRGSDELSDWLRTNIDIRWKNHGKKRFHRGFYRQAQELYGLICDHYGTSNVTFKWATGHSLGGAVLDVLAEVHPSMIVRGAIFGSPGVRRIFSHKIEHKSGIFKRCVVSEDPVPRVPLSYLSDRKTLILYNESKKPKKIVENKFSWEWLGALFKCLVSPKGSMAHHSIDSYLDRISS